MFKKKMLFLCLFENASLTQEWPIDTNSFVKFIDFLQYMDLLNVKNSLLSLYGKVARVNISIFLGNIPNMFHIYQKELRHFTANFI